MFGQAVPDSVEQDVFRHALVKGFELVQETSHKLLKKALCQFGHTARRLEQTPVKEILRLCAQHGLMTVDEVERWFSYRDVRNSTAHQYGEAFVTQTMALMSHFLADAAALESRLAEQFRLAGSDE